MIEAITKNYVQEKMGIPSYLNAPSDKPDKYVRIRKSGSSGDRFIETAIFIFYCVSEKSLYEAAQMNEDLKEVMYDMPGFIDAVSKVELNSDGNFTDTKTKEYRYQSIFEVTYHR